MAHDSKNVDYLVLEPGNKRALRKVLAMGATDTVAFSERGGLHTQLHEKVRF